MSQTTRRTWATHHHPPASTGEVKVEATEVDVEAEEDEEDEVEVWDWLTKKSPADVSRPEWQTTKSFYNVIFYIFMSVQ